MPYKDKKKKAEYDRIYREKNKEKLARQHKEYHEKNREKRSLRRRQRYQENREKELKQCTEYKKNHRKELALYKQWINRLKPYYEPDEIQRDPKDLNLLQIKCKYCGKWVNPTFSQLEIRLSSINGTAKGDHHIYCSSGCKNACPIFKQVKYPKDFKPATSREVQPELRKMVLKEDNWTCLGCGKTKEEFPELELHCHHIDPVVNNPMFAADVANCITLCKECHKWVHTFPGCTLRELRKCGINKKNN